MLPHELQGVGTLPGIPVSEMYMLRVCLQFRGKGDTQGWGDTPGANLVQGHALPATRLNSTRILHALWFGLGCVWSMSAYPPGCAFAHKEGEKEERHMSGLKVLLPYHAARGNKRALNLAT
eukprot:573147-Pelagomonas_calceolata.AAC.7